MTQAKCAARRSARKTVTSPKSSDKVYSGLGPEAAYAPDPTSPMSLPQTVSRIVLAFHLYNKIKNTARARTASVTSADVDASRRAALALLYK